MKLHIGCGSSYLAGFINIDCATGSAADLIANAAELPLASASSSHLAAYQVLEHLGYNGASFALAEWYRVLAPDGTLVLEVPEIEGSFRAFLDASNREARSRELAWIFGEESPGLHHQLLFPEELLRELLQRNGFTGIEREVTRTYPDEPGLRLRCRKRAEPLAELLAELRARVSASRLLASDVQPEIVEFEQVYIKNVVAAVQSAGDPLALGACLIHSAAMSSHWLCRAQAAGLLEAGAWIELAGKLACLNFNGLLLAAFCSAPPVGRESHTDYYEQLVSEAMLLVGRMIREERSTAALLEESPSLAPRLADSLPLCTFFAKSRCIEWANALRDRGLRAFARGELDVARELLERATQLGIDPVYAPWNLAVLHARRGELEVAAALYRRCLERALPRQRALLGRETAVCLLHLGAHAEAVALLADLEEIPDRRHLQAYALRQLGLASWAQELEGNAARVGHPPQLRTAPVMVGEGSYVQPPL